MTDAEYSAVAGRSILLYDGVCALCNRVVQLLLRIDREGILRFAPLQSSLGTELLAPFSSMPASIEGVVLIRAALTTHAAVFYRSDAVAEALRQLKGPWPTVARLLHLVPRSLREYGYGVIARNRYRLFGKFDACPVPTEAQRSRILGI
ncbi:MAG: DCC1-like thiol-disulfide oxidoreductase family protein [Granulicella sp.]